MVGIPIWKSCFELSLFARRVYVLNVRLLDSKKVETEEKMFDHTYDQDEYLKCWKKINSRETENVSPIKAMSVVSADHQIYCQPKTTGLSGGRISAGLCSEKKSLISAISRFRLA